MNPVKESAKDEKTLAKISVFKNAEFGSVRTAVIDGEPFFVGKDVALILGYENQNRDIIAHVDEDDRIMLSSETQYRNGIEFNYKELGQRGGWLINESGLYCLILSSKLPAAKKFKRWVTSEVLPSIRKTGSYSDVPKTFAEALRLAAEQQEEIERKNALIAEQKPKVEYVDSYCDATNLEEIGHLGKVTKIGEQKIFKRLLDDGYIKVRYSTEGVKCYDPCYGYEKYFETLHVPFLRGDKKLSRDKLMLTHKGFMFFRAKYATREMIEETADRWIKKESGNENDN